MVIRRYLENTKKNFYHRVKLSKKTDIILKSNLLEFSIQKTFSIYEKIIRLYRIINFDIGDTLNVIHGNYEILIVTNDKYQDKLSEILKGEKVKKIRKGIFSISLKIPKKCIETSGFYYSITKTFALANIPILDIINTETEATFILLDKHVSKAFDLLQKEINVDLIEK